MWGSEYSYSGLQNRASNGQTSTQMPQYMHSEKSMSKRSSAFCVRGLPPSRGAEPVLVTLDVDAPVRTLARAEHADGAVLLVERDHATGLDRGLFDVRVVHGGGPPPICRA